MLLPMQLTAPPHTFQEYLSATFWFQTVFFPSTALTISCFGQNIVKMGLIPSLLHKICENGPGRLSPTVAE